MIGPAKLLIMLYICTVTLLVPHTIASVAHIIVMKVTEQSAPVPVLLTCTITIINVDTNSLYQLMFSYAKVTTTSRSTIDHIVTNRNDLYCNLGTAEPGLSDHSLTFVSRKKSKTKPGNFICKMPQLSSP